MDHISKLLRKQPQEDMTSLVKSLVKTEMMKDTFPQLSTLAYISLTIPIGTALVERTFSHIRIIKNHLRNRLGDKGLSYLMKTGIESPKNLSDDV